MMLLNVGCGGVRPGPPWFNIDNLRSQLKPGTPERTNLDAEDNYCDVVIGQETIPFQQETFDGILCSHVIEHFTAHGAVQLLQDCRRLLKPGGVLVVSVPDAEYFLKVHWQDKPENAMSLFGEPISEPWQESFFDYALFKVDHLQVLTEASLNCLLLKAGFRDYPFVHHDTHMRLGFEPRTEMDKEIDKLINRRKFSVILRATKPV